MGKTIRVSGRGRLGLMIALILSQRSHVDQG